jgi:hypothetical protein
MNIFYCDTKFILLAYLFRHIYTPLRHCISTDSVTECYVATSTLLAVRSELLICCGFVFGILVSNTDKSMYMGILCFFCVLSLAAYATNWSLVCVCAQLFVIYKPQQTVALAFSLAAGPQ